MDKNERALLTLKKTPVALNKILTLIIKNIYNTKKTLTIYLKLIQSENFFINFISLKKMPICLPKITEHTRRLPKGRTNELWLFDKI